LEEVKRVVFQRDVKPFIPEVVEQPWNSVPVGRPQAYESYAQKYDNVASWTEDQRLIYRDWQNLGYLAASRDPRTGVAAVPPFGPYADTMQPTLVVRKHVKATVVGAFDPDSGINMDSLVITQDGMDVTDLFVLNSREWVWVGPPMPDSVVAATVLDNHGNRTTVERIQMTPGDHRARYKELVPNWPMYVKGTPRS
jgi:hypothetical protein